MPQTYVRPKGSSAAKVIIVGEQPGKTEVRRGEPFIGPSGEILKGCLNIAGIVRQDCYFTNVVKDLDNSIDHYIKLGKKIQVFDEGSNYINSLIEEINNLSAQLIIAVGNVALYTLTGRTGITKWRGSILPCEINSNKIVIPIIHPATILYPTFQYLNKHLIQFDLQKVNRVLTNGYKPLQRDIIIEPSFHKCIDYLEKCKQLGLEGTTIYYDLEIYNTEVSCISFSTDAQSAISIPFINSDGDYFPVNQEAQIWKLIAEILENPTIRKGGQNIGFDAHFLLRRYGIKAKNLDDTMVAQQIILSEYPKGLDFITSIHTNHPYYKDEGKEWFKVGGSWRKLWHYNATDSIICAEAFPSQWKDIVSQGNTMTYERQRLLIEPLVYMQERGIRVNTVEMKNLSSEYEEKIASLQDELNETAGRSLNPNSPKQLKQYFYIDKNIKPYKSGGKITVDDNALKRINRKGFKEAGLIRQIRKYRKLSSSYLDLSKIDSDGRIRCSYNPVGTRYSRISSSANIFGTGANLMNWPHDMLRFLLPDVGYVYYSFDLSQAENRIVAYVGRIDQMIEAFESGKDVHSLTGALISGKTPEEVKDEDNKEIPCSLGDGTKTWRFWGKKSNHGLNYDLGYKTFAFQYEIPENEGKQLVEAYHKAYPGVRNGFHSFVKRELSKSRTLTNLMGRKTLFLDKWDDNLFKAAYSCIPQGTTGDIINERGLIFIYYNQNQFQPIELLNQVHDSIGFQIPLTTPWSDHARMIKDIQKELEKPLTTYYGDTFSIPADLTIGCSLSKEANGVELKSKELVDDLDELAKKLESNYNYCLTK